MKSRLLTRFTSWFFNTSPEWVADSKHVDSAGMPLQDEQQIAPTEPDQGNAAASDTAPDPSQQNRR
jgi:hypothetical protein